MIISNVGAAGLNLTAASVVIIVSNVWSGLEKFQIEGHIHQYGQVWDVLVFDIVAPDGIDLALMGYSDSKTCLSNCFLMSQKALKKLYLEVTAPSNDGEEEGEEEEDFFGAFKATNPSTQKRKHQQTDLDKTDTLEGAVRGNKSLHVSIPNKATKISKGQVVPTADGMPKLKSKSLAGAIAVHKSKPSAQGSQEADTSKNNHLVPAIDHAAMPSTVQQYISDFPNASGQWFAYSSRFPNATIQQLSM
ncbi:hypothetical protein OPQ81_008626 [Rhizoctonia solani]|nr:hypothetical protein OPQ81_008626 [Rhizoctonia solani]